MTLPRLVSGLSPPPKHSLDQVRRSSGVKPGSDLRRPPSPFPLLLRGETETHSGLTIDLRLPSWQLTTLTIRDTVSHCGDWTEPGAGPSCPSATPPPKTPAPASPTHRHLVPSMADTPNSEAILPRSYLMVFEHCAYLPPPTPKGLSSPPSPAWLG